MIFFYLSKCIILSLLIKYNLYNDKIIKILLKNIYKCGVIPVKMIQWGLPLLKLLDYDKDILNILENTYEKCPNHDIKYTKEIYKNDFYNDIDEDYEILELIGSGSIAQVYKIKDKNNKMYAMKVIHPNTEQHYNTIKFYMKTIFTFYKFNRFIPISLNDFLDQFKKQLDLVNESNNLIRFSELYNNNNLFEIPKLYKFSKNIIIMDYIVGESIETVESNLQRYKFNMMISIFMYNNFFITEFNHGDLHNYNWKITKNNKIVVYDFGLCWCSCPFLKNPLDNLFMGFNNNDENLIYNAFKSYFKDIDEINIKNYFISIPEKIDRFFIFSKYLILFSLKYDVLVNINLLYTIITHQNSLLIYMKNFKGNGFDFEGIYKEQYNICDYYNILPDYKLYLLKQIKKFSKNKDYSCFNKFIK